MCAMFFDFDDEIEVISEELLLKALELSEKIVNTLKRIPIGKKLKMEISIRKPSDLVVAGLALKIVKHELSKSRKSFRITNTTNGWTIQITPRKSHDALEKTEDIIFVLGEIARLWRTIRDQVGEWIETYIDVAPRYVIDRFLRVFVHLDLLMILLRKISKIDR